MDKGDDYNANCMSLKGEENRLVVKSSSPLSDESSSLQGQPNENIEESAGGGSSIPKRRSSHYNKDFKERALSLAREIGIPAAAKKVEVSRVSLLRWIKAAGLPLGDFRSKRLFSDKFKQEVADHWQQHGTNATLAEYRGQGVNRDNLKRWSTVLVKPRLCPYTGKTLRGVSDDTHEKWARKLEIIDYARDHGHAAAASKYQVARWCIGDWKEKLRRKRMSLEFHDSEAGKTKVKQLIARLDAARSGKRSCTPEQGPDDE